MTTETAVAAAAAATPPQIPLTWYVKVSMPQQLSDRVIAAVAKHVFLDDLLDVKEITKGNAIEDKPHVTLHYGVGQPTAQTYAIFGAIGDVPVAFRSLGMFPGKRTIDTADGTKTEVRYDVLILNVNDMRGQLLKAHTALTNEFKVTWPHKSYHPHLTLAWLKEGRAARYFDATRKDYSPALWDELKTIAGSRMYGVDYAEFHSKDATLPIFVWFDDRDDALVLMTDDDGDLVMRAADASVQS